jgi:hypothetical protein
MRHSSQARTKTAGDLGGGGGGGGGGADLYWRHPVRCFFKWVLFQRSSKAAETGLRSAEQLQAKGWIRGLHTVRVWVRTRIGGQETGSGKDKEETDWPGRYLNSTTEGTSSKLGRTLRRSPPAGLDDGKSSGRSCHLLRFWTGDSSLNNCRQLKCSCHWLVTGHFNLKMTTGKRGQ